MWLTSSLALGAVRFARRITLLPNGLAKCHAGAALAPCAPHARDLHKYKMTQNERRAIQQDSADAQVQSTGKGEGVYHARREGRATRDARVAELATRELAMHPAVRHDAKVRHGRPILGCVGHPSCVLTSLPPSRLAPGRRLAPVKKPCRNKTAFYLPLPENHGVES